MAVFLQAQDSQSAGPLNPFDVRYLKRTVKDENDQAGAEGPQRSCSARLSNAAYPERASLFNGTRTGRANLADSSLNGPGWGFRHTQV